MAGLSNLLTNTSTQTTALPAWYSAAQQDAVGKATAGANAMPSIGNTVAGQAITQLGNSATNPFNQAEGTLNTIGQGAANPWLTDPTTGAVSPNTNTAMGGLFSAQNAQLQHLLPQYEAPATAGSIAGGNFGSLRGQTAADTALTNAQSDLFSKQMQAALTNQQTGVNAATGLGNVATQGITEEAKVGQLQQADPMAQSAALATLLGNIKAPETVSKQDATSPLTQLGQLGTIYDKLPGGITGPISGAISGVANKFGGLLGDLFGTGGTDVPGTDNPYIDLPIGGIDQFFPGGDQNSPYSS